MSIDTLTALQLAVGLGRYLTRRPEWPQPGDLVVEVTGMRAPDPDAIGWLEGQGIAPYATECPACGSPFDGTDGSLIGEREPVRCGKCRADVAARRVWDVRPLSGALGLDGSAVQRWENAEFAKVPEYLRDLLAGRSTHTTEETG